MLEKALFLRPIRSYVRRQGRISNRQTTALDTLWQHYGLDFIHQFYNFESVFGRQAPVILEIGFGMGQSLLAMALERPDINFVGVEVHRPGVGALLAELESRRITNVKVICHDVKEVLQFCIQDHSLDKVQIFFPDPWPKKRHHKRRLVQTEFMSLLTPKLKEKGQIHLATDCQDYAEQMNTVISTHSDWLNMAGEEQFVKGYQLRPVTKYELRGQRLGHGTWDLLFQKS